MAKSEKLVVLGVLLVVVFLFVWSLQSDTPDGGSAEGGVYASERDESVTEPRLNERRRPGSNEAAQDGRSGAGQGGAGAEEGASRPGALRREVEGEGSTIGSSVASVDRIKAETGSNALLLAETAGQRGADAGMKLTGRTTGSSTLADPAARSGVSRGRVRMQPGWDLVTTSGLKGTVDPSMFVYESKRENSTWESIAKDLYGDEAKAALLRHNNEGMDHPDGQIFVPAKDDLGAAAAVRTVEVLQGESLWQVAKRSMGKGSEWRAIYEANRDVISDPDFVAAGTQLRIPVR